MTLFGKLIKGIKNNVIPAVVQAASGNIGGAIGTLLKKNTSATVSAPVNEPPKPNLVLGYEAQNGGIVKADLLNTPADLQAQSNKNIMLYVLGGVAALLGVGLIMKKR